ncbi:hypothetical protein OU416_09115 [Saccharopolyspora indica]|uniref:helix-turn-helix domain-containing protein n=1 Tax=Saccharopolyspora indica TaxID=1229659 RepID=UPI0022EAD8CF|nr:helix-turn-helix domain-containing protein [Saccharopolyspora indica]MDA3644213.1 hypothetical protein [Saccharopolyspora indica]
MSGLHENAVPEIEHHPVAAEGSLVRAARPVLEQARAEFDGTPVGIVLADRGAQVLDVQFADRSAGLALSELGVVPGTRFSEEQVGTNALGTPLETKQGLLVRGPEHFLAAFRTFTCYGHPIVHPLTRRVEGVLDLCGAAGADSALFPPMARRLVRDIENRLQLRAGVAQRRLLAEFQAAARRRGRPVIVVGHGLVLATPPALDLLSPADHAAVRTCAEGTGTRSGTANHLLTLASGRVVRLRCQPVEATDGFLVDIVPEQDGQPDRPGSGRTASWPLLIVGESGSGRTTEARKAAGAAAAVLDATDVVRQGEQSWAATAAALLEDDGPAVIVEDVQLLAEPMTTLLAKLLRRTERDVVLTTTPGDHLDGVHATLVSACDSRRDLLPLRRRRHEIPQLAERALAETTGSDRVRLTSDTLHVLATQPWPGNFTELHRVIRAVAGTRSAGDIIPSDLPASHRTAPAPASPFREAEREVIVAAIEAAGGNKLQAARALGVSRSTLYNRMRALRIRL